MNVVPSLPPISCYFCPPQRREGRTHSCGGPWATFGRCATFPHRLEWEVGAHGGNRSRCWCIAP